MKKSVCFFVVLMMTTVFCLGISSCSKDEEESAPSIYGWWYDSSSSWQYGFYENGDGQREKQDGYGLWHYVFTFTFDGKNLTITDSEEGLTTSYTVSFSNDGHIMTLVSSADGKKMKWEKIG